MVAFLLGFKWPRTIPELIVIDQPTKPLLAITSSSKELTVAAPAETLLSIDDRVTEVGEPLSVTWSTNPKTIRWWNPNWSVEISLEGDLGSAIETSSAPNASASSETSSSAGSAKYVASSGGTKYHPSDDCHYADRIKPENRVYFDSTTAAEAAGYEPSSCFKK